jgi:hypothetical protein
LGYAVSQQAAASERGIAELGVAEHVYRFKQALELLEELGVRELCVFERRVRRLEPIGPAGAETTEAEATEAGQAGARPAGAGAT